MTTSTKELIDFLEIEKNATNGAHKLQTAHMLMLSAQRLRELDKPDCGWQYVGGNTNYIMGCNKRANGVWSLYCPNCGGAVKEST
jgi:hypothetical protein